MSIFGYKQQVSTTDGNAGFAPSGYGYQPYGFGYRGYPQGQGQYAPPYTSTMPAAGTMSPMSTVPSGSFVTPSGGNIVTLPAVEESYVENILRLNRGKLATFYMTYENNKEWNAKVFKGVIEAAGRDHIIISDPATGMRYLLLMLNLDYVTFDGPINYEYPFQGTVVTPSTPLTTGTTGMNGQQ
ncbi:spore coat protein GerQ [Paenibacillus sp. LHD-117]|uniref:spore coat protein GerQ n=1 Tax=Paenibacillus sp. LHD-117 TaxID=3071412 RepID=UPI0027E165E1|nr:spore coat protein GerQ [Paenibacillus sp. LHD-117]MDQ6419821.1 spore coat protein GerQ [Paenibacillus sp. LHD-117]